MHIVHLSTRPDYYGGEVCLHNLAAGFAARGHRVSCLVRPGAALAAKLGGTAGVEVVELRLVDWYDPRTVGGVRRWLREQRADVLASHLPRDYFICATASAGLPVCNIATRHQLTPVSVPVVKRPFLRGFGAVIAVSEAVAAGVHAARLVRPERVLTVLNGIAAPAAAGAGPGLRERCGVPAGAMVIGLIGKICPSKGADFLLRALARLAPGRPDLHVMLLGDAGGEQEYAAELVGLAAAAGLVGRVHFCGYVPDAANRAREFDVQVVASRAEPFGLVTVEAMACGLPLVATNTGGTPEIVRDGVEGFLVAPGDEAALAERLGRLLDSAELRQQMGARGLERYRAEFTVARMVERTAAAYGRALANCGRSEAC